jgi:hypothetical protein
MNPPRDLCNRAWFSLPENPQRTKPTANANPYSRRTRW